ncbi:NlpC/P60 family protein [Cohaesibacter gelatinilyticus]|uniref:NlpC/P60 family protein n=1 Tax=Cohaesibacter gelatinilyticus TaxID=372072 RepID=A0A285PP78_9HYPH|nr:NlpC/P60 family protein [Cohaesibacter gelatinilyticus]SNZ21731.1 NlpC/P60 family protein [Cohaesibacter gelatinilyticus]
MTPQDCISRLLGVRYEPAGNSFSAVDCFGVVELWYRHVLGVGVEDRSNHPPTHEGLQRGVESISNWEAVDTPQDHCLVLMQAGRLRNGHIGIYYNGHVLHADRKAGCCVCQKITDPAIQGSITGYLKHNENPTH